MSRAPQRPCTVHKPVIGPPHLALGAGPGDRLEYSRSVSGMELVMEELVEVMVLKEGLMP